MTQSNWPVDRIAQAIGDPGSIIGRRLGPSWGKGNDGYADDYESVPRWSTRAVLKVLDQARVLADAAEPHVQDAIRAKLAEQAQGGGASVSVAGPGGTSGTLPMADLAALAGYIEQRDAGGDLR